jgi:hypothetical protein
MKDFGSWFAEQGKSDKAQEDEEIYFRCGCGKTEVVSRKAYENGDTRWYSEDPDSGVGLCGSQWCMP